MADVELSKSQPTKRSRQGCVECRRRHRKCDETKPGCTYCKTVGKPCSYSRTLSWGGRPFHKSRFGKCLGPDSSVLKISSSSDPGSFVYGKQDKLPVRSPSLAKQDASSLESSVMVSTPATTLTDSQYSPQRLQDEIQLPFNKVSAAVPQPPSPQPKYIISKPLNNLSQIPSGSRYLLDYFLYKVTNSISCHPGIQSEYASVFVPMALESSHVFSAVLFLAARHRLKTGTELDEDRIERFRLSTLRSLSHSLNSSDPYKNQKAVATSLILCLAEVVSGGKKIDTLGIHLRGASALLAEMEQDGAPGTLYSSKLLLKVYTSLRSIALCCGTGTVSKYKYYEAPEEDENRVDDFTGYSMNLVPIFEKINRLDKMQDPHADFICPETLSAPHFNCTTRLSHESHILYNAVRSLMVNKKPLCQPDLAGCTSRIRHDYEMLDEAHHHMALLQIHRRGSLSVPHQTIQDSVQKIISCVSAMKIVPEPCPGVAALPPLFVAGCCASDQNDKTVIVELMKKLWVCYSMGNVRTAQNWMEKYWYDCEMQARGDVASQNAMKDESYWDILPY